MARQKNDGRGRIGGRQKGTPNKTTTQIRDAIAAQWQRYYQSGQFNDDLDALDPQTRATVMEKYAQYISPKMKSMDVGVIHDIQLTIEERLKTLCNENDDDE